MQRKPDATQTSVPHIPSTSSTHLATGGGADDDRYHGVFLAVSLLVVELCRVLFYGACWAVSYRTGIRVRGALLGLLYAKLVRLRGLAGRSPAEASSFLLGPG